MTAWRALRAAPIRRTVLALAVLACGVDVVVEAADTHPIQPPAVDAVAALPVRSGAPDPPFRAPLPTYPPAPHVSPIVTTSPPETQLPGITVPVAPSPSVITTSTTTAHRDGEVASAATAAGAVDPPALVARAKGDVIDVWNDRADRAPALALYSVTEFGSPRVFLATALAGEWVQVLLPTRPNGATGWVRSADVDVTPVDDRIDVDLAARTLTWTRAGRVVVETTAGIGAPSTPTPTGTFYVTDVLPYDPSAGRGRWVIALNAHSDAYTTFEGGDPRIAIHGTDAPSSIGAAVSNGCVRIDGAPLEQLRAAVPLGTPVVVH